MIKVLVLFETDEEMDEALRLYREISDKAVEGRYVHTHSIEKGRLEISIYGRKNAGG